MLKKSLFSPAQPRRAETPLGHAAFSHRSDLQHTPAGMLKVSLSLSLSLSAALRAKRSSILRRHSPTALDSQTIECPSRDNNFSVTCYRKFNWPHRYDWLITESPAGFPASMNTRRPSTRNLPSAKSWTARG